MVLPLINSTTVIGALSLARDKGKPGFSPADLDMAAAFADHDGLALELAAVRADQQRMVRLEDRDRIADETAIVIADIVIADIVIADIVIADIGVGIRGPGRTSGLDNLRARRGPRRFVRDHPFTLRTARNLRERQR